MADIVAAGGWSGFRDLEYEVARKCCALDEWTLLDCGGGIVVDVAAGEGGDEVYSERKAAALRAAGLVVYVERPVEYLEGRIARKAKKEAERTGDSKKGARSRARVRARTHTHTHTHTAKRTRARAHEHTHTLVRTRTHTRIRAHARAHTRTRAHAHSR